MDNSLLDVLVIVGAVVISVISAVSKARKKTAEKKLQPGPLRKRKTGPIQKLKISPTSAGFPFPIPGRN